MLRFAAFATALSLAAVPILNDPSYYAPYSRAGVSINGSNQCRSGAIRRDAHYEPAAGYDASLHDVLELLGCPRPTFDAQVRSGAAPLHPWR